MITKTSNSFYQTALSCLLIIVCCLSSIGLSQVTEIEVTQADFEAALLNPVESDIVSISHSLCITDPSLTQPSNSPKSVVDSFPRCSICQKCGTSGCYRGSDHVGELVGCQSTCVQDLLSVPVVAVHEMLEVAAHVERMLAESCGNTWLQPGPLRTECRCECECKFVNWRHGSMYLCGCIPEGYDLIGFIQTVPHIDQHSGPLYESGPVELGGDHMEATLTDGNDSKKLSEVALHADPPQGELPIDKAAEKFSAVGSRIHLPGTHRDWCSSSVHWNASLLNHQPLYFKDVNLERHGFSYGMLQPVVSGAKFFATLPALPYLMTAQPPHTTQYSLGETRPGNQACYVHELPPTHLDATLVEAGLITGLIFLIP